MVVVVGQKAGGTRHVAGIAAKLLPAAADAPLVRRVITRRRRCGGRRSPNSISENDFDAMQRRRARSLVEGAWDEIRFRLQSR